MTKLPVEFQKIKTSTITGWTTFLTQNSQDTGGFFIFFLLSSFLSFEKCKLSYVYWTVCMYVCTYVCMDVFMYVWMDVFLVASADTNKSFSSHIIFTDCHGRQYVYNQEFLMVLEQLANRAKPAVQTWTVMPKPYRGDCSINWSPCGEEAPRSTL